MKNPRRPLLKHFNKRGLAPFILAYSLWPIAYGLTYADTVNMSDGREIKGIVVEDYKDRIVLATVDGETTLLKSDIRELYFDSEEDNLIKLAEQARLRRDYARSFAYYDRAYKLNPNSRAAKDGLMFLQGYMLRKEEMKKEDDIKKRQEFELYGRAVIPDMAGEKEFAESVDNLKKSTGITLKMKDGLPEIDGVQANSPAYEAGVIKGDLLIAVWGRLTGYMSLKEVIDVLQEKPSIEIKCTIERSLDVDVTPHRNALASSNDLIGASFNMEFDGLTVSGVKEDGPSLEAGLDRGDLIVAIDSKSTRYMPLKKAIDLIRDSKGKSIKLTLRREVLIWRKK